MGKDERRAKCVNVDYSTATLSVLPRAYLILSNGCVCRLHDQGQVCRFSAVPEILRSNSRLILFSYKAKIYTDNDNIALAQLTVVETSASV